MGRNSNLILTDGEGASSTACGAWTLKCPPNGRSCRDSITISRRGRISRRSSARRRSLFSRCCKAGTRGQPFDKWLLDTFGGISPLVCREVTVQIFGALDAPYRPADGPLAGALADALDALEGGVKTPQLLLREGKPWDFACIPVTQYGETVGCETEETFSCLLDRFYGTRDQQERIAQKTQALRKT